MGYRSCPQAGERLVDSLLTKVRAVGGFRTTSPNYVGDEAIQNTIAAFDAEGFLLSPDGEIQAKVLDSLAGRELTNALALMPDELKRSTGRGPSLWHR
jgi:hypothetical protein